MEKILQKHLSDFEKGQIEILREQNKSNREISRVLNRNESTIRRYIKNNGDSNKIETRGRKKATTPHTERRIIREVSNKRISLRAVKMVLDLNISHETIRKVINDSPFIVHSKKIKKPKLNENHIRQRLIWANNHMTWQENWKGVIWSDEKKFNLDGPDGFSSYWHDLRKEPLIMSKRHSGGGSVMVWAAFGFHKKTSLCHITVKLDSKEYCLNLENHLLEFCNSYPEKNKIFMQDDVPCHKSKYTQKWLYDRNIPTMNFPPCSPDLNPIENLWGIMARKVYEGGRQFNSLEDLRSNIVKIWAQIEDSIIQKLALSMPERVFKLIIANGKSINY